MDLNNEHGIALYTDGSGNYVDGSGGWAWVAVDAFGGCETDSGGVMDTTNNRMELLGVINGLWAIALSHSGSNILVLSDSQYVVLGCQDPTRARRKNKDLWADMDKVVAAIEKYGGYIEFEHVRGHQGDRYNELADELAGTARKEMVND
jgi:ribonuclease HI